MANSSVITGSSVQHVWGDMIHNLVNVADATVKQNTELEHRVSDLEVQLACWKQAHSTAMEESGMLRVQINTLNKQISAMETFQRADFVPLFHCVINGDETFFSNALLSRGYQGGKTAAELLTKAIAECLSREDLQLSGRLSFWVTLFLNRAQLGNTLIAQNTCNPEQYNGFLAGFAQASPRFLIVDVCEGSVDLKIKEYLTTYTCLPQTLRTFIAGCNKNFSNFLSALENNSLLGKLVLLHTGPPEQINEISQFKIPSLEIDNLFACAREHPGLIQRPSPVQISHYKGVPTNGGLASPQSPVRTIGRFIDSSLPLHKQVPPPCNEHYLMACSKGAGTCKYSHDYILSPDQLAALASSAKKAPCNWLKNGLPCPYGPKCCWGHVCPNGPNCFHMSKGKCWFKNEGMHDPPNRVGTVSPTRSSAFVDL